MSRRASATALALGVATLGALVLGGATAATSAPVVVSTVSGVALVAGTDVPAAGASIMVYTVEGSAERQRDRQTVITGPDGTFSFNLAQATRYYLDVETGWFPGPTTGPAFPTAYAPGWIAFGAAPGEPVTCSVQAVPTSSWVEVPNASGTGTRWDGDHSTAVCDTQDVVYTPVYRYFSPTFGNGHLYTTDEDEMDRLSQNRDWVLEGRAFRAVKANGNGECPAGSPVYRFYSSTVEEHFYTISAAEKAHLIATDPSWAYEGVSYCAFSKTSPPGTTPLYRFWASTFGKHFYTASAAEKAHLIATDPRYAYEGVAYSVTR
ncbi:hypothetical protein [Cellulomonas sp. P5_C5]